MAVRSQDRELIRTVAEDLWQLRSDLQGTPTGARLRSISVTLRRLLIDQHYPQAWRKLGLEGGPKVRTIDLEPIAAVATIPRIRLLQAGGGKTGTGGATCVFTTRGDFTDEELAKLEALGSRPPCKDLSIAKFLESSSILIEGARINRREVIQYVAHKLGGAHFDMKRGMDGTDGPDKFDMAFREGERYEVGGLNLIYFELLSIGQCLVCASDTATFVRACRKAGLPQRPPSQQLINAVPLPRPIVKA